MALGKRFLAGFANVSKSNERESTSRKEKQFLVQIRWLCPDDKKGLDRNEG